jgi:hypothetical protein
MLRRVTLFLQEPHGVTSQELPSLIVNLYLKAKRPQKSSPELYLPRASVELAKICSQGAHTLNTRAEAASEHREENCLQVMTSRVSRIKHI